MPYPIALNHMTANTDHLDCLRFYFRPIRPVPVIVCAVIFGCVGKVALAQSTLDMPVQVSPGPNLGAELAAGDPQVVSDFARRLRNPEQAELALAVIADVKILPLSLWRDVSILTTEQHPASMRSLATEAVAKFGSRESIRLLVSLTTDPDQGVRDSALDRLPELTGIGQAWDATAWQAWGSQADQWTDREWSRSLIASHAGRHRELSLIQLQLRDELIATYRRLHVDLDAAGRSELLAELIQDERGWLRVLGFDLAGRDLSARTPLGQEVARAAAGRLSHPNAATRARAANLVSRLVPPDAMILLTRALIAEQDPGAVEPILLGIARWPNPEAVSPIIDWLARTEAPVDAAATALWSHVDAGYVSDVPTRERALAVLRQLSLEQIGESGMRTLVSIGEDADLDRIEALIESSSSLAREAAAKALTETSTANDRLIRLASEDPRMFAYAVEGVTKHMRTPEGMRLIAGLPTIDTAGRSNAIQAFAKLLNPADLVASIRGAELGNEEAIRILVRLTEEDSEVDSDVADGIILLAELRLQLDRIDSALETVAILDGIPLDETLSERKRQARLWIHLASNELEPASNLMNASLSDWLIVFGRLRDSDPVRSRAAAFMLERYAEDLTPETAAMLEQCVNAAPNAASPTDSQPDDGLSENQSDVSQGSSTEPEDQPS